MKKLQLIIRIALSLWMVHGVYTETGVVTGCFAFVVMTYIELDNQLNRIRRSLIDEQNKYIENLEKLLKKKQD